MGGYPGDPGQLSTRSVESWATKLSRRQAAEKIVGTRPESGERTPKAFRKNEKDTAQFTGFQLLDSQDSWCLSRPGLLGS